MLSSNCLALGMGWGSAPNCMPRAVRPTAMAHISSGAGQLPRWARSRAFPTQGFPHTGLYDTGLCHMALCHMGPSGALSVAPQRRALRPSPQDVAADIALVPGSIEHTCRPWLSMALLATTRLSHQPQTRTLKSPPQRGEP